MPELDQIQVMIDALSSSKADIEQKERTIKELNEKYKDLDAKVKSLEEIKAGLEKDIVSVEFAKEESLVILNKAELAGLEITKAATAESKEIVEKAKFAAAEIIDEAMKQKESIEIAKKFIADKDVEADAKFFKADAALKAADSIKKDAEKMLSEASDAVLEASKQAAKASKALLAVEADRKLLDGKLKSVEDKELLLKEKESHLELLKVSISDDRAKLTKDILTFEAFAAEQTAKINEEKSEISRLKEALIKQKDINSFRNTELDAGFLRLKRDQEDLRRQKTIIDAIKKELSSKGE